MSSKPVGYKINRVFYVDLLNRRILRAGQPLASPLTAMEFDVLTFFLEHAGNLINREDVSPLNEVSRAISRHPTDHYISKINLKLGLAPKDLFNVTTRRGYTLQGDVEPVFQSDLDAKSELFRLADLNFNDHTLKTLMASVQLSLRGIESSPSVAPRQYVTLAYDYMNLGHTVYAVDLPKAVMPLARAAAEQALSRDKGLGAAYGVLGLLSLIYDYDWANAEEQLKRALDLDPDDAATMLTYTHLLICTGRSEDGLGQIEKAVRIDPTDKIIYASRGWLYVLAGRIKEGLALAEQACQMLPEFSPSHVLLGLPLYLAGKFEEALNSYHRALVLELTPVAIAGLGHICGCLGRKAEALARLTQLRTLRDSGLIKYIPGYCEALIYTGLADYGQALDALQTAYEQRCAWLIHLGVEPRWEPIRDHPKFRDLARRVGIPDVLIDKRAAGLDSAPLR